MKEWQRWKQMAQDFERVDDLERAAESLTMALELLPPGHHEEKAQMLGRLERVRTILVEHGGGRLAGGHRPRTRAGERDSEGGDVEGEAEASEPLPTGAMALAPERTRETVMDLARRVCRSLEGADEAELVSGAARELDVEEGVVAEAVEDLVDEGLLYRPRRDRIMVDGLVKETDLEEAVLAAVAELSTGGRGASRRAIVQAIVARGPSREDVEEAVTDIEESGRIEDDGHGQVRMVEGGQHGGHVREQVLSAVRAMDEGRGVLRGSVVKDLERRGWEVQEVEEAIDELEEAGDIDISGSLLKMASAAPKGDGARERVLSVVDELVRISGGAIHPADVIKRASAAGVDPRRAHEALDALVDEGSLSRDRQGRIWVEANGRGQGAPRSIVLDIVGNLQRGHQGASRAEVIDAASREGLSEDEAAEALEELVDNGLLYDHGGFLRPG